MTGQVTYIDKYITIRPDGLHTNKDLKHYPTEGIVAAGHQAGLLRIIGRYIWFFVTMLLIFIAYVKYDQTSYLMKMGDRHATGVSVYGSLFLIFAILVGIVWFDCVFRERAYLQMAEVKPYSTDVETRKRWLGYAAMNNELQMMELALEVVRRPDGEVAKIWHSIANGRPMTPKSRRDLAAAFLAYSRSY